MDHAFIKAQAEAAHELEVAVASFQKLADESAKAAAEVVSAQQRLATLLSGKPCGACGGEGYTPDGRLARVCPDCKGLGYVLS